MPWDPSQYLKFQDQRMRPAIDLMNRIPLEQPSQIYDLGCGAGNVTRLLKLRWPEANLTGIDDSAEMLERAATTTEGITWEQADLATWQPLGKPDLIYTNAALHWIPDHARLIPPLLSALGPGGVLAIQMPRNFAAPSHTAITEAALGGPWRSTLEPLLRPTPVEEPAFYFDLLAGKAANLDMWETEYLQVLQGDNPVKEWTKGTWLSPLLSALQEPERSGFEEAYAKLTRARYPQRPDGRTLFPFRRLFIIATAGD
jgi:trans-aconitate 2-methyltransferase